MTETTTKSDVPQCSMTSLLDADNKNAVNIICQRCVFSLFRVCMYFCFSCPSTILLAHKADYVSDNQFALPHMQQSKVALNAGDIARDTLTQYWRVDDAFVFENAGFTNTVDGVR
jgi:hypothetical protein